MPVSMTGKIEQMRWLRRSGADGLVCGREGGDG